MPLVGFSKAQIRAAQVHCFTVPTDAPEADGTYQWDKTTMVLVEVEVGRERGIGYTYADFATAKLAHQLLAERVVHKCDAMETTAIWRDLNQSVRNVGREGVAAMAISAIDNAVWDLKAKLLDLPLYKLLGPVRSSVQIYGSGGFTSYSDAQLRAQLAGWASEGIGRVKMKIGEHPEQDLHRVRVAREAIGNDVQLFVDANGAYTVKQALAFAHCFTEFDVRWFEEPVSSDDLAGLRLIRDRAPAGMDIAAGEYGYNPQYFERMISAGAVDVIQADATRCGGVTGFMRAHALAGAHNLPLSAHCAPTLHMHLCCAAERAEHIEYFHDHVRIEHMLFDGVPGQEDGRLAPDRSRPGFGIELKRREAQKYAA